MPAHIKQRGSIYYLIDGEIRRSLKTTKKGLAEARLEQYIKGQFGIGPRVTVREYYDRWIANKENGQLRKSALRDYRQHFSGYLLSEFGSTSLATIRVSHLSAFIGKLLARGLSVKTCQNVLGASFRALWRDAMIEGIVEHNPFDLLQWQRQPRHRPDPFTTLERDRIIAWWVEHDFYFYPYVYWQFHTGCRPSETAALTWDDINVDHGTVSVNASLVMGEAGATKTEGADRIIPLTDELIEALRLLPSEEIGLKYLFVGKRGKPMTKKWAEHHWKTCLEALGIRYRKFHATRHTFITEQVMARQNLKAIADHCGTSVMMIEKDYCARQGLGLGRSIPAQQKPSDRDIKGNMVAGPGFEPITTSVSKRLELASSRKYEVWKKAQAG